MILVDTREKQFNGYRGRINRNIKSYFDEHGIEYELYKLDVGDYMNKSSPHISVDHKLELQELAMNLCTKDINRFKRELRRANKQGIELVVLCENKQGITDICDVATEKIEFGFANGIDLVFQILKLQKAYKVKFEFCYPDETGKRILEILQIFKHEREV